MVRTFSSRSRSCPFQRTKNGSVPFLTLSAMNLSAHAPMRPDCPAPPLAMRSDRVPFVPYRAAYCGPPHDWAETKGRVAARIKDAETNVDLTICRYGTAASRNND